MRVENSSDAMGSFAIRVLSVGHEKESSEPVIPAPNAIIVPQFGTGSGA